MPRLATLAVVLLCTACKGPDSPDAPEAPHVFVDREGSRLVIDPGDGEALVSVPVQGEPNVAVAIGDRWLVTLRTAGAIGEFDDAVPPTELRRLEVGTEPFDLEPVPNNPDRVWVSLSMEYAVVELDLATGAETWRAELGCEPRFLASVDRPDGPHLFVSCVSSEILHELVPGTDTLVEHQLPVRTWVRDNTCPPTDYQPRVSGDMVLHPDGRTLLVPAYYVAPLAMPGCDGDWEYGKPWAYFDVPALDEPARATRTNPVLVTFDTTTPADSRTLALASPMPEEGVILRGYPTSVHVDPRDDATVWVSSETSSAVFVVDLSDDTQEPTTAFHTTRRVAVDTSLGVRDVFFRADRATMWSPVTGELSELSLDTLPIGGPWPALATADVTTTSPPQLADDILRGRQLFFDTRNVVGSNPGSGVVCATCHIEGRSDQMIWEFGTGIVLNTLSFSGPISDFPTMTWAGLERTIVEEVESVSQFVVLPPIRLGNAEDVAAYIDFVRPVIPHIPRGDAKAAQVALGEEIFNRPAVGCAGCHSGPHRTTWQVLNLFGVPTRTPPLVGLRASPPYLHDGSAPTLRDVMERSVSRMGDVRDLSEDELDALIAYLETL